MRTIARFVVFTFVLGTALMAQDPDAAESSRPAADRLAWWREARFGMFVHWGLYAIPAGQWGGKSTYGEWIRSSAEIPLEQYEGFAQRFDPRAFDPAAWAALAKRAGMRYLTITTKHHDGFCLFDSKLTDFDGMATPQKRDFIRDVVDACRKDGIVPCFYYSIMDWRHPDYLPRRGWEKNRPTEGADFERYVAYMNGQVEELLTNYGPIGVLWFDGQWEGTWSNERGEALAARVRRLQPEIIVNNRVGRAAGEFRRFGDRLGDYATPEQEIPATNLGMPWETCMTMNDHWGFSAADKDFKSTTDLLRMLVDIASKGGNFLLNVGPDADGRIPAESVERLERIGDWLKVNGEAIYGTTAGPMQALAWGRTTAKKEGRTTRLYLHVFDWPTDGRLAVDGLLGAPIAVEILGSASPAAPTHRPDGLRLVLENLPEVPPCRGVNVIKLTFDGAPDVALAPTIEAPTRLFVKSLEVRVRTQQNKVELRRTLDGSEPTSASPPAEAAMTIERDTDLVVAPFRNGQRVGPTARARFVKAEPLGAAAPPERPSGLDFHAFEGDFTNHRDVWRAAPVASGTAAGFGLGIAPRPDRYAISWRGSILVPADDVYTFTTASDDGSMLWIDDLPVVDNDRPHSLTEKSGEIALARGHHRLAAIFFENTGGAEFHVYWQKGGGPRLEIPATVLAGPTADPKADRLKAEVEKCLDDLERLFDARDFLGIARRYADDAQMIGPDGVPTSGRAAIDAYWLGLRDPEDWILESKSIEGSGAVAVQRGRSTLLHGGRRSVVEFVLTWRLTAAGWRIASDIYW